MDITIRNMTEADVDNVVELEGICFTAEAWRADDFLYRINDGKQFRSYVAEQDGKFCGYLAVWSGFGEMFIDSIAVSPDFRRRGVAKRLIEEATDVCKPQWITLEVRVSNAPARTLYKSLGFEEIAVRKNYYDKPVEDCIIMKLLLDDGENQEKK